MLNFILWDVAPELFTLPEFSLFGLTFGPLAPRYYGLLFAAAFLIGQTIYLRIAKIEGKSEKLVESLTLYMIAATIIGARLGHCIFYEPQDFFWEPEKLIRILYIWEGGLASHGGGIAIFVGIWLYCKKYPTEKYIKILDRIAIIVALAGCFIRFGNLMNSEIIGKPTDAPQGFVFMNSTTSYLKNYVEGNFKGQINNITVAKNNTDTIFNGQALTGIDIKMNVKSFGNGDVLEIGNTVIRQAIMSDGEYGYYMILSKAKESVFAGKESINGTELIIKAWGIPRHPAQLYESISSLLLFFLLIFLYLRYKAQTPEGLLFGIFMIWIFTLRFLYEFIKENQVTFENDMAYNMGQLLSIPMVIIGVVVLVRSFKKGKG